MVQFTLPSWVRLIILRGQSKLDQWITPWYLLTLNQREHLVILSLKWLKLSDEELGSYWQLPCPLHGQRLSTRKTHMQRECERLHSFVVPECSPPEAQTCAPDSAFHEITHRLSPSPCCSLDHVALGFLLLSTLGFEVLVSYHEKLREELQKEVSSLRVGVGLELCLHSCNAVVHPRAWDSVCWVT